MPLTEDECYLELGLSTGATLEELKRARNKLAIKYHPDKQNGSTEKMQRINEAYETLHQVLETNTRFNTNSNANATNNFNTRFTTNTNQPFTHNTFGQSANEEKLKENINKLRATIREHCTEIYAIKNTEKMEKMKAEFDEFNKELEHFEFNLQNSGFDPDDVPYARTYIIHLVNVIQSFLKYDDIGIKWYIVFKKNKVINQLITLTNDCLGLGKRLILTMPLEKFMA